MKTTALVALICFSALYPSAFGDEPTIAQVRAFGEELAEAIEKSDEKMIAEHCPAVIDLREIAEDVEFHYIDKDKWIDSLQQRIDIMPPLYSQIVLDPDEVSSCRLVGLTQRKTGWTVVLRLIPKDANLAYVILGVEANEELSLEVKTINTTAYGQIQDWLEEIVVKYAAWEESDGKISPQAPDFPLLKLQKTYGNAIVRAANRGEYLSAVRYYQQIPRAIIDLQEQPFEAACALQAALELQSQGVATGKTDLELEAIETIKLVTDRCTDSPVVAMLALAHTIDIGESDKALKQIETIRQTVGDDPFLKLYEAHALIDKGEKQRGNKLIESALTSLEDIHDAYLLAALVYAGTDQFDKTIDMLEHVEAEFELSIRPEKKWGPDWASFVASDAYRQWIKDES